MRDNIRQSLRRESPRVSLRLSMIGDAATVAVFWPVAIAAAAVLAGSGYSWLAWLLLGLWVALALPAIAVQLFGITDALLYALTRRVILLPGMTMFLLRHVSEAMERESRSQAPTQPLEPGGRRREHWSVWGIAGMTMPTSMVARWCWAVVSQAPESAWLFNVQPEVERLTRAMEGAREGRGPNTEPAPESPRTVDTMIYRLGRSYMGTRWPRRMYAGSNGLPL
jgi:hypothetical protein